MFHKKQQGGVYIAHKISNVINQGDASIVYPGISTKAFTDTKYYGNCGKTGATGTIKANGCAICALATYALYKGGLFATNNNIYYAVEQTTINATNSSADVTYNDFSVKIGSKTINISMTKTSDMADAANNGKICFVRLKQGSNSHYVLLDGMDSTATGFDRYLVADPDGGKLRTLQDVFERRGITANASYITEKYILG